MRDPYASSWLEPALFSGSVADGTTFRHPCNYAELELIPAITRRYL